MKTNHAFQSWGRTIVVTVALLAAYGCGKPNSEDLGSSQNETAPTSDNAISNLALDAGKSVLAGDFDTAISLFSKGIEQEPDLRKAIADYSKIIAVDPQAPGRTGWYMSILKPVDIQSKQARAYRSRAEVYRQMGDTEKADADEAMSEQLEDATER